MRRAAVVIVLLASTAASPCAAQPGPSPDTVPFEGIWIGHPLAGEVIVHVRPTVLGPMEVIWIVRRSVPPMRAGRCMAHVDHEGSATWWRCAFTVDGADFLADGRVRVEWIDATHIRVHAGTDPPLTLERVVERAPRHVPPR